MKVEKVAKTIEMAVDEALKELNLTIDQVDYEILQDASRGFFGFGSKPAKVLVYKKEESNKIKTIKNDFSLNQPENKPKDEKKYNIDADKIARKFLQDIFDTIKSEIKIEIDFKDKTQLNINLVGNDMGNIIGKRGQTLDSLQYLVNLVVNKGEYAYININLDCENYRSRRKETLQTLAINLSKKVKMNKRKYKLEPMSSYERRIIHSTLQDDKKVSTHSEGNEPNRYVVICPKYK